MKLFIVILQTYICFVNDDSILNYKSFRWLGALARLSLFDNCARLGSVWCRRWRSFTLTRIQCRWLCISCWSLILLSLLSQSLTSWGQLRWWIWAWRLLLITWCTCYSISWLLCGCLSCWFCYTLNWCLTSLCLSLSRCYTFHLLRSSLLSLSLTLILWCWRNLSLILYYRSCSCILISSLLLLLLLCIL